MFLGEIEYVPSEMSAIVLCYSKYNCVHRILLKCSRNSFFFTAIYQIYCESNTPRMIPKFLEKMKIFLGAMALDYHASPLSK